MDDVNLNLMRIHEREYENLDREIKRSMKRTAAEVVRLGYFLRKMRDERLYLVYYTDFDSYLQEELHIDYSKANRFMNINKKFSFGGNSMAVDEKYEGYSQSLLEEMLSMPDGLEEKITPDMTARQAREIKRQAKQQEQENTVDVDYKEMEARQEQMIATPQEPVDTGSEVELLEDIVVEIEADAEADSEQEGLSIEFDTNELLCDLDDVVDAEYKEVGVTAVEERTSAELSAYGLLKTEYPHDSLLTTEGCGQGCNGHSCFLCAQECNIRQKERYCVEAPLGNPYGCTTMNALEIMRADGKKRDCQFLNLELAPLTARGNPEPCCKECPAKNICSYCCNAAKCEQAAVNTADLEEDETEADIATPQYLELEDELTAVKGILEKEKKTLDDYLAVDGLPEALIFKQKTIVGALAGMVYDLENTQREEETEQPELPAMTNNSKREAFLDSYPQWPVWIDTKETGERYYRYLFQNGTSFVVKVYFRRCFDYKSDTEKFEDRFHDEWGSAEYYIMVEGKHFKDCQSNRTAMVEFLKHIQKKGDAE